MNGLTAETFRWTYTAGDRCTVQIDGFEPVHFDGSRRRTRQWLDGKHANGTMHEPNFAFTLARLVQLLDPSVYFDVGGYIGYFALFPLPWLRPGALVYSFEMNPLFIRQIRFNVDQNRHLVPSRVFPINAGLSDEVVFARASHIEGFALDAGDDAEPNVTIDLLTLDYVHETMGLTPDLIKMDIEGFEARVLRGGEAMLREAQPTILFELHSEEFVGRHGETRSSVLERLEALGYELFALPGDRWDGLAGDRPLIRLSAANRADFVAQGNSAFVAAMPNAAARLEPIIA